MRLDNTLYDASLPVMSQVEHRITQYVMEEFGLDFNAARAEQKAFLNQYGTTLSGLMINHRLEPAAFLDYVHDIDYSVINRDDGLVSLIKNLPGQRYIFTNGSERHAKNVLKQLGLLGCFDAIFDIAASDYVPKPNRASFDEFNQRFNIRSNSALMFEDSARNLVTAASLGYKTVLIKADAGGLDEKKIYSDSQDPDIHYVAVSVRQFLANYHSPSL